MGGQEEKGKRSKKIGYGWYRGNGMGKEER